MVVSFKKLGMSKLNSFTISSKFRFSFLKGVAGISPPWNQIFLPSTNRLFCFIYSIARGNFFTRNGPYLSTPVASPCKASCHLTGKNSTRPILPSFWYWLKCDPNIWWEISLMSSTEIKMAFLRHFKNVERDRILQWPNRQFSKKDKKKSVNCHVVGSVLFSVTNTRVGQELSRMNTEGIYYTLSLIVQTSMGVVLVHRHFFLICDNYSVLCAHEALEHTWYDSMHMILVEISYTLW